MPSTIVLLRVVSLSTWVSVTELIKRIDFHTWLVVSLDEVLISKLGAVDRFPTSAVTGGEVTSLEHEVWDYSMEYTALVVEGLLADGGGAFLSCLS